MSRKILIGLGLVVAVLFAGAWLASPMLAVRGLIDAARTGDEAKLERLVDFPAFRESMKDELNARLRAEMQEELGGRDSPLAGLGMMLAPALIDGAVDAVVTAPAIAAMVRTAEAPDPLDGSAPPQPDSDEPDLRQSYGYRGLNTFALTVSDPERPEAELDLLLERRGLFSWKLAGVNLPEADPPP